MMTFLLVAAPVMQVERTPVRPDTTPADTVAVARGPRRGPSGFGHEAPAEPAEPVETRDTTTAHHRVIEYSD